MEQKFRNLLEKDEKLLWSGRPERFETRSSEPFDPSKPPVDFYDRGEDSEESSSFDDRLSRFMKSSEERLSDLKKQTENKRGGGYVRRG